MSRLMSPRRDCRRIRGRAPCAVVDPERKAHRINALHALRESLSRPPAHHACVKALSLRALAMRCAKDTPEAQRLSRERLTPPGPTLAYAPRDVSCHFRTGRQPGGD